MTEERDISIHNQIHTTFGTAWFRPHRKHPFLGGEVTPPRDQPLANSEYQKGNKQKQNMEVERKGAISKTSTPSPSRP